MYEKNTLIKIFHNKKLHSNLGTILPGLFTDQTYKLIVATMKELYLKEYDVTISNIIAYQGKMNYHKRKYKINFSLTEEVVNDILYDMGVDSSPQLFQEVFEELHDKAFLNYVKESIEDIDYELAYKNKHSILARSIAIQRVYKVIYSSKFKANKRNQIQDVANSLNKKDQYLKSFSSSVNSMVGGYSFGFITTMIGKPQHGKSTFMTYDVAKSIKKGIRHKVDWIGVEETPEVFWRRIFAIECGLSLTEMKEGKVKISQEQVKKIEELYRDKIDFHEVVSYNDIVDLVFALDTQQIVLDHINAIDFPKGDQYNGIVKILSRFKSYLKEKKETNITVLSQVSTKQMLRAGRLKPSKEDAYNSSVLDHASREFYSTYYPYKDAIDPETQGYFVGKKYKNISPSYFELTVEKNSFGDIGTLNFNYSPEFGKFEDKKNVIINEDEKENDLWDG